MKQGGEMERIERAVTQEENIYFVWVQPFSGHGQAFPHNSRVSRMVVNILSGWLSSVFMLG